MQLATILDEYVPLQLKEDNITDLKPALDGGYLPQWHDDPLPPGPPNWIVRTPYPFPPETKPVNLWTVAGEAALAVVGLTLVLLALLTVMGVL